MLIPGQQDLFSLLEEAPAPAVTIPPFTVYTCVYSSGLRCGWCRSKKGWQGGGAERNPHDDSESWFWNVCHDCSSKHGWPRPSREEFPVVIDRTQTPRPTNPQSKK